jgi:acyl-CoA thioesterase FadM
VHRCTAAFTVHARDADAFRELPLPALSGYLEEVAGRHAAELGCGIDALLARGLGWVMLRQRVEALAPLRLGDALEVVTWPSGVERLVVTREFEVRRGADVVARASTAWLVLDLAARRPVRPDRVLDPALRPRLPALAPLAERLAAPPEDAPARRFEVRYADIDANDHVNNGSYLGWAVEGVPRATWRGARAVAVEAHYLAEAVLGDAVIVRTASGGAASAKTAGDDPGPAPATFLHLVTREADGKELSRLATAWAPR